MKKCENCPFYWDGKGFFSVDDKSCDIYDSIDLSKVICYMPMFIKNLLNRRRLKKIDKWIKECQEEKD